MLIFFLNPEHYCGVLCSLLAIVEVIDSILKFFSFERRLIPINVDHTIKKVK